MKRTVCSDEIKKPIVLETHLTGKTCFCSIACLLWYLKELCPATFVIKPTEIGLLLNKKARELKWD